jgi:hypothetical protein
MLVDQMELEQSRGRLAELTSLFQLGNTLHMDLPLETILEITVRRLASTLHSHDVALFLYDPTSRKLPCEATFGLTARGAEPDVTMGEGAVGWVARHHEPILMRVTDKEARFANFFVSLPESEASDWRYLFASFAVAGNNGEAAEKNGRAADLGTDNGARRFVDGQEVSADLAHRGAIQLGNAHLEQHLL